ncbi:hypothetical protein BC938DRAFT_481274 [Jimgerdemannia flammicorona]|uniref:RWD domain-containing protein n=1 Tax=Jimgerdemannia flammicorona TaxID=994334 RepID=A0A433QX41_9FUNG|nr:hypothetical protein BC938DRAFT_481274 [Jimgerdemannia flammicorona]
MRPASSFCAWTAGATQVKFNRKNEFLLASAHDTDVKIWDIRKGSLPVNNITAHTTKIYGIDWNRQHEHIIVTCSLDKLVKFWDINTPNECKATIQTNSPVWRARHTPFGNGILTMPQRSETTLSLWNCDKPVTPAYVFHGHTDTVKEFVWRWRGGPASIDADDREFQLVTWSKDQHLRLWPISDKVVKSINHIPSPTKTYLTVPHYANTPDGNHGAYSFRDPPHRSSSGAASPSMISPSPAVSTLRVLAGSRISTVSPLRTSVPSSTGAYADAPAAGKATITSTSGGIYRAQSSTNWSMSPLVWMQNVKTVRPTGEAGGKDGEPNGDYRTLAEELTAVMKRFINIVKFEKVDFTSRYCVVTLHGPWSDTDTAFLRVTITFPPNYPDKVAPVFDIQKNAMISMYRRTYMQRDLTNIADNLTGLRRPSLEACLRYLLGETPTEELDNLGGSNYGNFGDRYGADGDSDDDVSVAPSSAAGGLYRTRYRYRSSVASDRNDAADIPVVESLDQNVPFPRLCGAVFSGDGRLVTFYSPLRVHDASSRSAAPSRPSSVGRRAASTHNARIRHPTGNDSRYLEPTFSDYYERPKSYERYEEYKEIAELSKPRNTAAPNGNGFGTGFDDDPDDQYGFAGAMSSIYYRPKVSSSFHVRILAFSSPRPSNRNNLAPFFSFAMTHERTFRVATVLMTQCQFISLPKKMALYGSDPVAICRHNARVCREHQRRDLQKVWLLAAEILKAVVPLFGSNKDDPNDPMAIAAEGAKKYLHGTDIRSKMLNLAMDLGLMGRQRRDSGTGLEQHEKSEDGFMDSTDNGAAFLLGRAKWGLHPLGRKLVDKLFHHFLQLGDVQMLSMLSCVFREPFPPDKLSLELREADRHSGHRNYESDVTQPGHPNNMNSNTYEYFNNHYMRHPERYNYASAATFWPSLPPQLSHIQFTPAVQVGHGTIFGPSPVRTSSTPSLPLPNVGTESLGSKGYFGMNFGSNSDSHNLTPPTPIGSGLSLGHEIDSNIVAMEGTNTATYMAGNRVSFLGTGEKEGYPPNYNSDYKGHQRGHSVGFASSGSVKPRQNSLPLMSSSVNSFNVPSPPVTPRRPSPSGYRFQGQMFAGKDGSIITTHEGIVVRMVNPQDFDDEKIHSHHVTLLDAVKAPQLDAYRIFYSDMLYRWGLFERRAELLKFVSFAQGVSAGSVWREMRNAALAVAPVIPSASQSWNINPSAPNVDVGPGSARGNSVGSLHSKSADAAHGQSGINMTPLVPLPPRTGTPAFPQGAMEWLLGDREQCLEVELFCYKCGSALGPPDNTCSECHRHRRQIKCTICHHLVKGPINFCIRCGHGGHTHHMREWFEGMGVCPTGCGCACVSESSEAGV